MAAMQNPLTDRRTDSWTAGSQPVDRLATGIDPTAAGPEPNGSRCIKR